MGCTHHNNLTNHFFLIDLPVLCEHELPVSFTWEQTARQHLVVALAPDPRGQNLQMNLKMRSRIFFPGEYFFSQVQSG